MSVATKLPYRDRIAQLIKKFPVSIDTDVVIEGRMPTSANSEFLINKEQGDWAERIVRSAINESSLDYVALRYGRGDTIAAGDPGFAKFYTDYQHELNTIGKKPDILLFRKADAPTDIAALERPEVVSRAVAAIEVRSSSFLCKKYKAAMANRMATAECRCMALRDQILQAPYGDLLKWKKPAIHAMLENAKADVFRELTFRAVSWSATEELATLSSLLKDLKANIALLHKRDYLSITPKVEDIALVNRWIAQFNVPHFYLQVFFDSAYMISFEDILSLCCDPARDGSDFSIETDVKNQGKTTVKVNVDAGKPVIGKIDMPTHASAMKELDRGRLQFYVKFDDSRGYLDLNAFNRAIAS